MSYVTRAWVLTAILAAVALAAPHSTALAQTVTPSPNAEAKKKADPAAAAKLLAAGVKSYEGGKLDAALQSLNQALRGGGLTSQQIAKALYYRGLTYRKQGKPALAVSDLTSSIWLKGGLSDSEKADAQENRTAAYREAGLSDVAAAPAGSLQSASVPATSSAWTTATTESKTEPKTSATVPAGGTGFGSFFSNILGGSATASAEPPPPPRPKAPESTASTAGAAAVSAWSDATEVAPARVTKTAALAPVVESAPSPPVARAPVAVFPPAPATVAAPPARSGKFRLQVAAVRSRAEAETLAARLKEKHGPAMDGLVPAIDEVVLGNMGTFYRVRLGPYAEASEPRQLCGSLKADGFDCLIVTK